MRYPTRNLCRQWPASVEDLFFREERTLRRKGERLVRCILPRRVSNICPHGLPVLPHRRAFHSSPRLLAHHTPIEPMSWYNLGQYVMDLVNFTHDVSGASYTTSICAITIAGRLALSPLIIMSLRNNSRRDQLMPKIEALQRKNQHTKAAIEALFAQYGYKPSQRFVLPLTTMSITIAMWYGLRWMGHYYPDEMMTGGLLWFENLAEPDPLNFLPILSAASFYVMGELDADGLGRPTKQSFRMRWLFRGLRLAAFPVLMDVPASVHCFWIPNAFLSIAQTLVLSQPAVMTNLGIGEQKTKERSDEVVFIKDVLKDEGDERQDGSILRTKKVKSVAGPNKQRPRKGKRR